MALKDFFWTIIAAGGGGAVVAFAIFKGFGEKWLDSKFAGRLQNLRHEHERQMETVRLETLRTLDRSTRLSEREFEVSAEAWSLVFDAYTRTMGAMPGLRQYSDFARLSDDLARTVAEASSFEPWEIDELMNRAKADRLNYFAERMRMREMQSAKSAIRDASNYLNRKALFLDREVFTRLDAFVDFAWKAVVAREIVSEVRNGNLEGIVRDDEDFRKGAEAKIGELEQLVRGRFWPAIQPPAA